MPGTDYINKQGLAAAIEKLRTLCMTQSDGAAICAMISVLADAVVFPAVEITIPATGWQSGAVGEYTVYIDVAAEVTAADSVDVALDTDSILVARNCGLCPTVETLEGALRFRAIVDPAENLAGEFRVIRGAALQEQDEGGTT